MEDIADIIYSFAWRQNWSIITGIMSRVRKRYMFQGPRRRRCREPLWFWAPPRWPLWL